MLGKVLILENDISFADFVKKGFEEVGVEATVVTDGQTGIDYANKHSPDLVFASAELHGMNGFLVCKKFKKDKKLKNIPFVILSNKDGEYIFEEHRRLKTSAQDYICKPVGFEEIYQRAKGLLTPIDNESEVLEIEVTIDEDEITLSDFEDTDIRPMYYHQVDTRPMKVPTKLFVGSSPESSVVVESLCHSFTKDVEITICSSLPFGLPQSKLGAVAEAAPYFDYAVFAVSPRDLSDICDDSGNSPRDNFLIEFGLFLGALGKDRVFVVHSKEEPHLFPLDLADIEPITYSLPDDGNLEDAIEPICSFIKRRINDPRAYRR